MNRIADPSDGRGAVMRALFDEAVAHGRDDRASFLRAAARERRLDEDLVEEVIGLLAFVDATRIDEEVAPDADSPDRLVGCRLGAFTLDRLIGIGGTAAVFEATQDRPRRTVAVKVLRQAIAGPRARRRFEREIEIAGRLEHASIARVLDSGTMRVDGFDTPWLAMEFVPDARTITRYADEERIDLRGRVRLVRSAVAGIAAAHRRAIIHRDLKPANVLVDRDGRVRVIDFGIARQFGGSQASMTATVPGQVIGTVPFMAPEQLDGDSDAVDVRTDVYAIGVLLHLILTGRMPYETADCSFIEAARRIREVEVGSLRRIDRSIDRDLDGIVQKMLAKDPDDRYPSIDAVAIDLDAWLAGEPVAARPLGRLARSWRTARRHPLPSALGILVAVLMLTTVVGLAVMLDRESSLRAEADRSAANAGIAAASAAFDRGESGGVLRYLEGIPEQERGWESRWLRSRAELSDHVIALPKADVMSIDVLPAESGRSSTLLVTSYRGTWSFTLPDVVQQWQVPEFSNGGSWKHAVLPEARRIAICGLGPEMVLADLDSGDVVERWPTPGSVGTLVAVSDDRLMLGGDDGILSLFDLKTGTVVRSFDAGAGYVTSSVRHPDGGVLVGTQAGDVFETDADLSMVRRVASLGDMVTRLRFDRGGGRVVACLTGGDFVVLDATDHRMQHRMRGHDADIWDARFDDRHGRLVTVGLDETIRTWDHLSFEPLDRWSISNYFIWSLALESDGSHAWVGSKDGSVRRVDLDGTPSEVPGDSVAIGLAWSPDAARLAVRTETGVRSFEPSDGIWGAEWPLEWKGHRLTGDTAAVCWTSSGIWTDGGREGGLWRLDPETGVGHRSLEGRTITDIAPLADGEVIVTTFDDRMAVRLAADGAVVDSVTLEEGPAAVVVDRHRGEAHVLSRSGGRGTVVGLDPFEIRDTERPYGIGPSFSLACTADGSMLAAGCRERPGCITLLPNPLRDETERMRKDGHSGDVTHIAFLDDGRRLVTAGDDGRVVIHRTEAGDPLLVAMDFGSPVSGFATAPDGQAFAVTDGRRIRIADPER